MILKSAPEGVALREPIRPSGSLDSFSYDDTTPVIGREYYDIDIVQDVLNAPNVEERLRDLAYISESIKPLANEHIEYQFYYSFVKRCSLSPPTRQSHQ